MFLYTTSSKFSHKLKVVRLSEENTEDCLNQVSEWIEKKWGYLRDYPGLEKRKDMTKLIADELYVLKYSGQPIGMFRLANYESDYRKTLTKELTHVYIAESFRGLGIGGRLVEIAKKMARLQGANLIVLDTLTPNLNKFYEKHGATQVCESKFLGAPATLLKIGL